MPTDTFHRLPAPRRRRIIDAAIDEFAAHGYEAASLNRIVTRARISKGSVYQYFHDKADLYRWLCLEELARRHVEHTLGADGADDGDVFARIEARSMAGLRFFAENPRLVRFVAMAPEVSSDPQIARIFRESRAAGRAWARGNLKSAQERGEIRADVDIDAVLPIVLRLLGDGLVDAMADELGLTRRELLSRGSLDHEETTKVAQRLIRATIGLLRHGMGPPPVAQVAARRARR